MANGQQYETEDQTVPGIPLDVSPETMRQAYRDLRQPAKPVPAEEVGSTPAPAASAPSAAVDLAAWACGELDAPFEAVDRAIRDYGLAKVSTFADRVAGIETPADAVRFLIEEGVIDEDEARVDV
jgi:hypothetical protein